MAKNKKKKNIKDEIIETIITVSAVFVVFIIVIQFVQIGRVSGNSMETTYHDNQLVMLNKFSTNYDYNDVITFEYSDIEERYYYELMGNNTQFQSVADGDYHIKRVVGLPGDQVDIVDSSLYINGEHISDSSIYIPDQSYVIEDDFYFVQGDNLDNSFDSRLHGPIPAKSIFGIVMTGDN